MIRLLVYFISVLFLFACSQEKVEEFLPTDRQQIIVAAVLPLHSDMAEHWQNSINWALENIETAQRQMTDGVQIVVEWYDENTIELEKTLENLAVREDVAAIIGPFYSAHTQIAATQCAKYKKPLFTLSSSADLVRSFANDGFLWALTETDIAQCEVLLSKAQMYGAKTVALLAQEDPYGQTFIDWFAFQAKELGLKTAGVVTYTDDTAADAFQRCAALGADCMICVPSSVENLQQMVAARKKTPELKSRLLYSDVAFNVSTLSLLGKDAEGMEGVSMSSDPASGFDVSYEVRFGQSPVPGEAHMYDALMLIAYAAYKMQIDGTTDMNAALRQLVDGREMNMGSWMPEDMRLVFKALARGGAPDIDGATGSLEFDHKVYTNVLHSVYANWLVYDGRFLILDYNTSDGSKRTEETLAGWNWKISQTQDFDQNLIFPDYPELHERWALLIAASEGWNNYRHQADVLEVYRLLKKEGYQDDHIVLIMADDLANNPKNPEPGVIRVSPDGENLYSDVQLDYRLSEITPADLGSILSGEKSERLPQVIGATAQDNVFVFWSGHGNPGELLWGNTDGVTEESMHKLLTKLSTAYTYRKMLWLVETCYSGSVAQASVGVPGVLFITATDENETSKADIFSDRLNVWMTNRFTSTFQSLITADPDILLRDLYYGLFQNTVGSHVTVYNDSLFDNLYRCSFSEFLQTGRQPN